VDTYTTSRHAFPFGWSRQVSLIDSIVPNWLTKTQSCHLLHGWWNCSTRVHSSWSTLSTLQLHNAHAYAPTHTHTHFKRERLLFKGSVLEEGRDANGEGPDRFEHTTGVYFDDRWWLFVSVSASVEMLLTKMQILRCLLQCLDCIRSDCMYFFVLINSSPCTGLLPYL